ncbi:MarR family transcriptional regulator [Agrobacterium sp. SHOUNA12C]|uniref:HTH marR-type domain-containing protein n=1 Tax=Rhizobium rhizogenes NBRC 13257 TaxID=1220581 RepID=A0AA87U9J5_RHIRH|nr:MarR family transcriptional regulator [Rhizobium rhizogenes]MCJ9720848.1 MarR family transcriptional regulator [Agrobacterium sp. BETTINA12B]MCJ9761221.1 MarR family transcriptional regulator [Agrobacterium sp. SHOUNA12C]OCI92313.1 MarR family transcriptional regulator [Agrobacterium sp. 13-626]OCJ16625.1 MarR family transcriptional regulator [Agrobacterium sp. B133/95]KEA05912.1 MarR family transcriptional regulator [Rhizobium rhizogenes]
MAESESGTVDLEVIVQGAQEGNKKELRLWLRMLSTTKLISREIRRRLRNEFGATLPQLDLMAQLYREHGGLRLGELSKRTMVTNGNVTGLVERLETDCLVLRVTPGGDRRVTVAKLTKKGDEIFTTMAAAHEGWLRELMADVEPIIIAGLWKDIGEVKSSVNNHLSGAAFD